MKFGTVLCLVSCLLLNKGAYASESKDQLVSPWQKWLNSLLIAPTPSKTNKHITIPGVKTGGGQGDPQLNTTQKLRSPTVSTGGGQGDP